MSFEKKKIEEELSQWFFETYFNHWVEVGNGSRKEGPEFILQYWGTPMYASFDDPEISLWMKTDKEIVDFLVMQHEILKAAGYSHTEVPDKRVTAYNKNGGAIEVIWSRQAPDNTEIQRMVCHFEVLRIENVWKVVGVQARNTSIEKDNNSTIRAWEA